MSISKLQTQITQVIILAVFSAAGFETAAAIYSWKSGEIVVKYLILAVILLAAGLLLNEFYRRAKAGSSAIRRMAQPGQ